MQVIPSIDIVNGRCVRLFRGDFENKTVYEMSPAEMAERFIQSGARSLHVVDLDGARDGHIRNWDAMSEILALRNVEIQVGGGIRTEEEIKRLLKLGAGRVVVGSVAVKSGEAMRQWAEKFGPAKFCVALDLVNGQLVYGGWLMKTDRSLSDTVEEMMQCGISNFLSTDIRKDGTLEGPNVGLYASLVREYPQVEWFASGGVRSADDVRALKTAGVSGAIVGKALFEGKVRLEDLLEAAC
jgi:phosphoribosylformimino-5-aminoimidazole carboxamide ribotide isomerase